jgi:hypothetical protein
MAGRMSYCAYNTISGTGVLSFLLSGAMTCAYGANFPVMVLNGLLPV